MHRKPGDWPIHEFKVWREDKKWSLDKTVQRLAKLDVHLKPRSLQAIEYGFRRPEGAACFAFQKLTENAVSAEYMAKFPLRPRSETTKSRRRSKSTAA